MSRYGIKINKLHRVKGKDNPPFIEFYEYEAFTEKTILKPSEARQMGKYSFGIDVDGDGITSRNFIKDPYFKIFDGSNITSSNHRTRISIYRPEYVIHLGQKWELSANEKKNLIKVLNHIYGPENKTVWQLILEECINQSDQYIDKKSKESIELIENLLETPIPDYTKLKLDKKK